MKTILFFIAMCLLNCSPLTAQVGINATGSQPHPSAGLDVNYPDKGFLPPRLTAGQISTISDPAAGLMVFNITENTPAYFDGTDWRNFDGKKAWLACGDPLKKVHIAGNVAPVNKTVYYGTVTNIPGETSKCWITSNLGSDHQATAYNDATETSAGWYWQFNNKQGYQHDGTTRTPNTDWITSISENFDWTPANDPCTIELGSGWRIPTKTEWNNVVVGGSWTNFNGPWNSGLILHQAGRIESSDGILYNRGTLGRYWGGSQENATTAWALLFSSSCYLNNDSKSHGYSVRCIKE